MLTVVEWAEEHDEHEITAVNVNEQAREWMTELDVFRLSEILWGFLNIAVHGEARGAFDNANILDGLNAWRLVIYDMRNSRWVRTAQLRQLVRNVPKITRIDDVPNHIMKFEAHIKEYVAAAGEHVRPSDVEQK